MYKIILNIGNIAVNISKILFYSIQRLYPIRSDMFTTKTTKKEGHNDIVNDYIDSWEEYDMNNYGEYITEPTRRKKDENYKPYKGPICETP